MALPSSGPMRLGADVNVELGLSATAQISLGSVAVRGLYGVPSGAIRLAADGYGKASAFFGTITTSQQNLNLRTWALANGWNGTTVATITVDSGVYIWSDTNATAGLIIDGSWPNGITLINNGFIIGKGGRGGGDSAGVALAGGAALSLGTNVTITNNSYIAGGGGGGGCQPGIASGGRPAGGGGGGAGGGDGGDGFGISGGTAGTLGAAGGNGSSGGVGGVSMGGGGGGRILPGTGGASITQSFGRGGGSGGSGGAGSSQIGFCGPPSSFGQIPRFGVVTGGGGGGWGAAGGTGASAGTFCEQAPSGYTSGAGGSASSVGGNFAGFTAGASVAGAFGGNAVALNGFSVTWNAFGTRYGAIS
jgi:hypothetical protein